MGSLEHFFPLVSYRSMDLLTLGTEDSQVDLLLSEACQDYEELALLTGVQEQSVVSAGGQSPSFSEFSSSESGIASPGTGLLNDDLLDGFAGDMFSLFSTSECQPILDTPLPVMSSTSSKQVLKPLNQSNSSKPQMSEETNLYEPKVKVYQDGQKLSDNQIQRNRKNAIAARENRQRKKEYLTGLEQQVSTLSTENKTLKQKCNEMEKTVNKLQTEVQYLKSVLANQSSLSTILQGLPGIKGVRLSAVPGKRTRDEKNESMPSKTKKVKTEPVPSGGICLHIAGEIASLEFCPECSLRSTLDD